MADPLITNRVEKYTYRLLDAFTGNLVRELKNTSGGSLNFDADQVIQSAGQVNVTRKEFQDKVDWARYRIQIIVEVKGMDPWPLGVFLPSSPDDDYQDGRVSNQLNLEDKLTILESDKTDETYFIKKGEFLRDHIVKIIGTWFNENTSGIQASTVKAVDDTFFDPGITKLTLVNEILKTMQFMPLYADGNGVFQARPYNFPADVSPSWSFSRGESAIHLSGYKKSNNLATIPNKVVLVADGSSSTDVMKAVVEITDTSSPAHKNNRGGLVVTYYENGVDAETPTQLMDMARRKLVELAAPATTLSINHLTIPLDLHDIVSFTSGETNELKMEVTRVEYNLTPGSLCNTTLKGVVTV